MKLILLADFLSKYEISRKIDSLNDKFNSLVDKEKYPNVNQKYRFEEI